MSQLEIRKLADCMKVTFVIVPVSELNYNTVLQEQNTAKSLIPASFARNIATEYRRSGYDRDARKLLLALQAMYDRNLVLNSYHVQEQILNLLLENTDTIAEYVRTLQQLYYELAMCRRSASLIDIFDTLTRVLSRNWKATKCQLQSTVNAERKHYIETKGILQRLYDLKGQVQILLTSSTVPVSIKINREFPPLELKEFVLDLESMICVLLMKESDERKRRSLLYD